MSQELKPYLTDRNLSLKAKGLMEIATNSRSDWTCSLAEIKSLCSDGESAIKSALRELESKGYLRIIKYMPNETESGRIEYVYDFFDAPFFKQGGEKL